MSEVIEEEQSGVYWALLCNSGKNLEAKAEPENNNQFQLVLRKDVIPKPSPGLLSDFDFPDRPCASLHISTLVYTPRKWQILPNLHAPTTPSPKGLSVCKVSKPHFHSPLIGQACFGRCTRRCMSSWHYWHEFWNQVRDVMIPFPLLPTFSPFSYFHFPGMSVCLFMSSLFQCL